MQSYALLRTFKRLAPAVIHTWHFTTLMTPQLLQEDGYSFFQKCVPAVGLYCELMLDMIVPLGLIRAIITEAGVLQS